LFPGFFSRTFFPYYFPLLFQKLQRLKSNVLKYQWVVCSSTCRYNTVHVPCGISIQTSPVGLPLDGWSARSEETKNEFTKPKRGLKCFIVPTNHITGNWTNQTLPLPAD
jgi:hypothetical protein